MIKTMSLGLDLLKVYLLYSLNRVECRNLNDDQALDINLDLDNPKCV